MGRAANSRPFSGVAKPRTSIATRCTRFLEMIATAGLEH